MYCKHCGKEIDEDNSFCPFCGKLLSVEDENDNNEASSKEQNKTVLWVVIALVIIAIAAVSAVFILKNAKNNKQTAINDDAKEQVALNDKDANNNDEVVKDQNDAVDEESNNSRKVVAKPLYAGASSQHDDMNGNSYQPENVIDSNISTAWVEGADGYGEGEWISVTFNNQGPIEAMRIRNGYQKSNEAYTTNNRVKDALVEFEDGSIEKVTLLDMNNTEQIVVFSEEKRSNTIKLIIKSAYLSYDESDTCITEIGILERGMEYPSNAEVIYAEKY